MIPTYPYSLSSSSNSNSPNSSTMPNIIDLNIVEDQSHELIFRTHHNQPSSSSSSSLSSCPILFNPSHHQQDHAHGSSFWGSKNLQNHDYDKAGGKNIIGSSGGSWNDPEEKGGHDPEEKGGGVVEIRKRSLKLKVWKRSSASGSERDHQDDENHQTDQDNDDSVKWMPSKMRMMRKMMASDHNNKPSSSSSSDINIPSRQIINSEDQNQNHNQERALLLSPRGTDNNGSSSNNSSTHSNSNITVRVCADCHTTKTPLWRSGPRGPKSLCNACGIRQRKARRAMAAVAAANGSPPDQQVADKYSAVKGTYKVHSRKEKKLKLEYKRTHHQMKKKHKLEDHYHHQAKATANNNNNSRGRSPPSSSILNKFSFEDFTVSLMSKNLAASSQVFPQDEKEAAILLMALSCNGLVHG